MRLSELQNRIENLQGDLCIIAETTNAIASSLEQGVLAGDKIGWALVGIVDKAEKAAKEVEEITKEIIKAERILTNL